MPSPITRTAYASLKPLPTQMLSALMAIPGGGGASGSAAAAPCHIGRGEINRHPGFGAVLLKIRPIVAYVVPTAFLIHSIRK